MSLVQAEKVLRESGIRVTRPRVDVYDYILKYKTHPTCEEIYDHLKDINPSLSLATVYNVTEKLVGEKLLIKLTAPDGERRFDGTLEFHGHFYCECCGSVTDFECSEDKLDDSLAGFEISDIEVKATGLCPECRAAINKS